ncbi:hypothetical protein HDU90_009193 [Geranomyces variabilis]|nr:hypothetical protein HDU90_009193 [Geranomyces variabilis]
MDFGGASAVHATGQQSGPPPPPSDTSGTANTWHLPQSANNPAASSPGRNPSVVNQSFRPNFANSTTPFNPSTPSGNATPGLSTHSPQATLSSSAAAELRELERDQDAIDYFNVQHLTDLPPLVDDEELSRMFAADAAARERLAEASNSATPAPAATAAPAAVGGSLAVPGPTTPKSRKKKKKKGAVDALHPTSPGTGTQSGGAVQQRPQANAAGSTTTAGGGTTTAASHAHATAAAAGSAAAAPPPPRAPASASPFLSQDTGTIFDKFRKPISNYRARTARYEKEAKLGQHAAAAADWHCWFCEYEQAYGGKLWRGGGKGRGRKAAVDVAAPAGGSGRKVRDGAAVTVPPPPPNGKQAGEGMSVPTTTTTTTATVAAAGKQAPSPARVQQQQHAHAPSRPMVSKASA